MLLWLGEYLTQFYSAFNVFSYLTFSRYYQYANRVIYIIIFWSEIDSIFAKNANWSNSQR